MSTSLKLLEAELKEELETLEHPPKPWLLPAPSGVLDVAIVGGGMAGLVAAAALLLQGISNITVFDSKPPGLEGAWVSYARMLALRSGKELVGPALNIPKLTFRAWYTAQYGIEEWKGLYKIPTAMWVDYLRWYKSVLSIPVKNQQMVSLIKPQKGCLELQMENQDKVVARKVVLATGRGGFGGVLFPEFVRQLPKTHYAHTCDSIDFDALKGKRVVIVGVGASAFDAAATALERGAADVTILARRQAVPSVNKFANATYPGFSEGFYKLDDETKIQLIQIAQQVGAPPPVEALDRVKGYSNFRVLLGRTIQNVGMERSKLVVMAEKEIHRCDYLILATGFEISGYKQPELKAISSDLLLWQDLKPDLSSSLGTHPYLGRHFEFLEKNQGTAPYLKHLYCFNYAATLSHGLTCSDIPDISTGALRLAQGIAADFFTQDSEGYLKRFQEFDRQDFLAQNYTFIQRDEKPNTKRVK